MLGEIQFSSFREFLEMGGYAFNVWSVYGLFGLFLAVNLLGPRRRRRRIMRDLRRRRAFDGRPAAPPDGGADGR